MQASEKNARLAAQAIEELINEYRLANGLNPLVTHEVYDAKALGWSQQMVADLHNPEFGEPVFKNGVLVKSGAFRHSNREDFGYSGENVVFKGGYDDSEEAWRGAAADLFEDWRDSPSHIANMLSPVYQWVGLGLVRTASGQIWGTTMFFIDDTSLRAEDGQRGTMVRDDATEAAIASGTPFYVPAGARARFGVPGVTNPTVTDNHTVSLSVTDDDGETWEVVPQATGEGRVTHTWDKTKGAQAGLDPLVTGQKIEGSPIATATTQTVSPSTKPSSTTPTNAPTKTPVQNPSPANPPAGNGGGGSSSVGIVVGVVLALLAVVGAVAVAIPMFMPGGGEVGGKGGVDKHDAPKRNRFQ